MNREDRQSALRDGLAKRILVLDGAMGTAVQALELDTSAFGGADLEGCNENLVKTRPDLIEQIHRQHLEAGADIIETDTFGGTPLVLAEYGLAEQTIELNQLAAEIARKVADEFWTPEQPRFVAGSIGPTTKAITVTGGVSFDELITHFETQARGLHQGGVDYFLIETCQDTRNTKAALRGITRLFDEGLDVIPIAVSGTIEQTGTMLAGQSIEAFWASLAHLDLLYLGLNCATGPKFMTDHLRSLSEICRFPVACVPNAGLPNEEGMYTETPASLAKLMERFVQEGWVNLVGGCCGTRHDHIAALAKLAKGQRPRKLAQRRMTFLSGVDFLEITDEKRPILVGERTNIIGSRKFKKMIEAQEFEAATEIGRQQVKNGAQIIDICLANPDRDELEDMDAFLAQAQKIIRAPWMIDSTDEKVIRLAFSYAQGKILINSINLEDGEEKFKAVAPLIKRYGAGAVVGTIDEDPKEGMALSRSRKLAIAQRSFELLTGKHGLAPEDLYFDPLVFPCASGDEQYMGSAVETIEGVRLIKQAMPECKTVLGISNVSFGLPTAGREILNAVFLQHCTLAGLDLAIVNTQMLKRFPSIPQEERELSENLLFNRGKDPIAEFAAYFRQQKEKPKTTVKLPLDQRVPNYVVEGSKEGLIQDLDQLMADGNRPMEIINGSLMQGMDEVGRLFGKNELIVAEVLQSAEVMKAAVDHLKPHMKKNETASRGKMLLATVKGDVHDIGKNLVDIIFSNNGFEIENLGIKVPPAQLIEATLKHKPDFIGLSGLLVKSAQQMVSTAEDFSAVGIDTPLLLGGAALSRSFTRKKVAPQYEGPVFYAQDAMAGLELAKRIVDPDQRTTLLGELKTQDESATFTDKTKAQRKETPRSDIKPVDSPPPPPDFDRHILKDLTLNQLWPYLNPRMLLGRHLGLQNSSIQLLQDGKTQELTKTPRGQKALEIWKTVEGLKKTCDQEGLIAPQAVYQFFSARAQDQTIHILKSDHQTVLTSFDFPRKPNQPFNCLADYLNEGSIADNLCMFVTTAGKRAFKKAEELKNAGEYLKSHILLAMALETAEAMAEYVHQQIRTWWGQPDSANLTKLEMFQAHYTGKRYSFGYPACPDLEGQTQLFELLRPQEIGVELTDGFMMEPECSVSAIAFHHPQAKYFSI